MKIYPKKEKNGFTIIIESFEDLYYLDKIIEPEDLVGKVDFRTTSRGERGEKKKAYIKIRVKNVSLDLDNKQVRVLGEITEAPEDILKGHHSFVLTIEDKFDLYKSKIDELFRSIIKKLKSHKSFNVLGVVVDNKEATFGEIRRSSVKEIFTIKNKIKKGVEDNEIFYEEVADKIDEICDRYDIVILAGPGFAKDEVMKKLKNCKAFVGDTSVTGETGLKEIVRRGLLSRALRESTIEEEISIIERFFEELKKQSGLVTYGFDYVMRALDMGAVETLIIAYEYLKIKEVKEIFEKAEHTSARIIIVEDINPYYNQIKSMGGVLAFLRYSLEF